MFGAGTAPLQVYVFHEPKTTGYITWKPGRKTSASQKYFTVSLATEYFTRAMYSGSLLECSADKSPVEMMFVLLGALLFTFAFTHLLAESESWMETAVFENTKWILTLKRTFIQKNPELTIFTCRLVLKPWNLGVVWDCRDCFLCSPIW